MKKLLEKTMLTCKEVEDFLIDYVDGEMNFVTRLQFRMHIGMCRDCNRYLKAYINAIHMEKQIFEHPDDEAIGNVPDEILNAILSASSNKNNKTL